MMRAARMVLALAIVLGASTFLLRWWSVPVVAALWGGLRIRRPGRIWIPAAAGALAWAALLAWTAARGPVLQLAGRVGGIFGLPGAPFILIGLLFPALLAAAAAGTLGAARDALTGPPAGT